MVNGVLYATAGTRRDVVALDAATGELLWVHGDHEGARAAASPRQLSGPRSGILDRRQRRTHPVRDASATAWPLWTPRPAIRFRASATTESWT